MQTIYRIHYGNGRELITTLAERAQAEHDSEDAKVYATTGDDL